MPSGTCDPKAPTNADSAGDLWSCYDHVASFDDHVMQIDGAGLRVLTREECLAFLAASEIGRIAISAQALPLILPVRFAMDGDRIVICTHHGTTLDASTRNTVVAFEADGPTPPSAAGWSVHVNGIARHITDPDELRRLSRLGLPSWSPQRPPRIIAISTDQLSGRSAAADVPLATDVHLGSDRRHGPDNIELGLCGPALWPPGDTCPRD